MNARLLCLAFTFGLALPLSAAEKKPFPAAPAKAPTATVRGNFTANGKTVALTHAAAYEVDSPSEKGQMDIVVILSDRALRPADVLSTDALEAMMTAKKLNALRVVLNSDCHVRSAVPYAGAMKNFVYSAAMISWKPTAFDEKTVAGRFFTDGPQDLGGETWSYDLTFSAPIVLDPAARTVKPAPTEKPAIEAPPVAEKAMEKPAEADPKADLPPILANLKKTEGTAAPIPDATGLIVRQIIESNGEKSTTVIKASGSMVRTDNGPDSTSIVETNSWDTLNLIHSQKMAMRSAGAQLKTMIGQAMKGHVPPTPKATGKKETVAGAACDVYTFTDQHSTTTLWVSPNYPDLARFQPFIDAMKKGPGGGLTVDGIPGILVKSEVRTPDRTSTVTIESMKTAVIPGTEFREPRNYQLIGE